MSASAVPPVATSRAVDHVIVGGGVLGCSIAYHLALEGAGTILVLERNELVGAASSRAAGLILQATTRPASAPLARATVELFPQLEAELGEPVGFHPVGSVRVAASPLRIAELERVAATARSLDIPHHRLDAGEICRRVPWLTLPPSSETLFLPGDGYVDPYLLGMAYARAARSRGVELRPRRAVTCIVVQHERVTGVEIDGVRIPTGCVIDAAGAWAGLLSSAVGFALPMVPVRSHYWIAAADPAYGADHPVTVLSDAAAYTRHDTTGLVVGVQEPRSKTFDARKLPADPVAFSATDGEEHWDVIAAAANAIGAFFPGIASARFAHYVSGLSTYTPDGALVLGRVPGVRGLLVAAGCCGSGIALSGGIGALLSDLALERAPRFDVSAFDPGRFGEVDPFCDDFRARCAAARAAKAGRIRSRGQLES